MTHDRQRGTILAVDDNVDVLGFTRTFLENAGYTVITAAGAEQALCLYAQHRSSIALLLTDVAMPNIDGFELADRVLGMDSSLPVVFMSGSARFDYRGLECLAKPFRPAELIEIVSRVVNRNPHSARAASAA